MTRATPIEEYRMRHLADFFDPELTPLVRRMAYRDGTDPADDAQLRGMVWQGLVSLGATRLAVPASYGGGGGASQVQLVELAGQLGETLYQGPLLDTVTASELALRTGSSGGPALLTEIAGGASVALAVRADGTASPAEPAGMTVHGDTIETTRRFVGFAADADHLVVPGRTPDGIRVALVPCDHPSVALRRHEDLGRGELYQVRFAGTPVTAWLGDGDDWAAALAAARIRHAGYLVGLSQGVLDLAVGYARRRHQFGQPIGRFQSIAFRLSALAARIDAARLLTIDAARRADTGDDHRYAAYQCLAVAAELARTATTEALQVHGAAGMLDHNDAQLFYRRAAVEAMTLGTPTQLRAEAVPLLRERLNGAPA